MKGLIVSTDRLISASEARKRFGQLLGKIAEDKDNYFVILENGRLAGVLIHPDMLHERADVSFYNLETVRSSWHRNTEKIAKAMKKLEKLSKKDLPPLLR